MQNRPRTLTAILATPPLSTSGARTLARVEMARDLVGASSVKICNLLNVATNDVLEVRTVGADVAAWQLSRQGIRTALANASDVLLAWGVEPTGRARQHHRTQVAWVMHLIAAQEMDAWVVGAQPRHPSRWQRYTSRAHSGLSFSSALELSLGKVAPDFRFD